MSRLLASGTAGSWDLGMALGPTVWRWVAETRSDGRAGADGVNKRRAG